MTTRTSTSSISPDHTVSADAFLKTFLTLKVVALNALTLIVTRVSEGILKAGLSTSLGLRVEVVAKFADAHTVADDAVGGTGLAGTLEETKGSRADTGVVLNYFIGCTGDVWFFDTSLSCSRRDVARDALTNVLEDISIGSTVPVAYISDHDVPSVTNTLLSVVVLVGSTLHRRNAFIVCNHLSS